MKSLQQSLLFGACLFLKALFSHLEYALAHWERKRLQHRAVIIFFSSWVFFHFHSRILSRIARLQWKAEGIPLIRHYHFHPLYKNLDISRTITAESSPLHIGSIQIQTGNFWFPSAQKKYCINDFFNKFSSCNFFQFPADLVTFTKEIVNRNLHFLYSIYLKS